MIVGEIADKRSYYDVYDDLLEFVKAHFTNIQFGAQGDVWIWIEQGEERVSLDSFTSMQIQIKTNLIQGYLADRVVNVLKPQFVLKLYAEPEIEGFEIDFESE